MTTVPVLKIDIIKSQILVPEGSKTVNISVIDGLYPLPGFEEAHMTARNEEYNIHKVTLITEKGPLHAYHAIKSSDYSVMNELLMLMRQDVETGKKISYDQGYQIGYDKGVIDCFRDTVEVFAKKPWWYRLFMPKRMMDKLK